MRHLATFMTCALVASLLPGCTVGSGEVITETRSVEGFDEIELQGSGEVRVNVNGTESLVIEAEDNLIGELTSDVEDGVLVLGFRRPVQPTEDIVYTVTMETLTGLAISGSGSITVTEFSTEALDLDVSGSGSVRVSAIATEQIFVTIGGSGAVSISGDTDELDVSVAGSGSFDGAALTASEAEVVISGSGSATVDVSERLDVDVSGSGSVEYSGDPTISVNTSGSGSVTRR